MKIAEIEEHIKSAKKDKIRCSERIRDKLTERGLTYEKVTDILIKNEIEGIVKQRENICKIWLKFTKDKDLNVILRINSKYLYIVSAFPCDIERRIRKNGVN